MTEVAADSDGRFEMMVLHNDIFDGSSMYCLARAGLWHIRSHACNIEGTVVVGCALPEARLQPGQTAVVANANAWGYDQRREVTGPTITNDVPLFVSNFR
jgi:hypothetical protein